MSSIGSSLNSTAAQFLSLLNSPATAKNGTSASSTTAASPDSVSDISQFSQLLNKLQTLSQTDPTKFKSLTSQIAAQLNTAAGNATGSQAQFLSNLAGKFTQASQDGNISPLQPQQTQASGGHGHHHHHGSGQAYSSSADTQTQDAQSVLQNIFNEVQSA